MMFVKKMYTEFGLSEVDLPLEAFMDKIKNLVRNERNVKRGSKQDRGA